MSEKHKHIITLVGKDHADEAAALIENCDTAKLNAVKFKSPKMALILSILCGFLGIDRLYQGGIRMFAYKIAITILTMGTWYIADFYFNKHSVEEDNYQKLLLAVG